MAISRDDVKHVAGLARLGIPEAALGGYVEQLNSILGHMDALQRVRTTDVGADDAPGMLLRDDRVAAVPLTRPISAFAPLSRDGFFLVPRLATHEDPGEES